MPMMPIMSHYPQAAQAAGSAAASGSTCPRRQETNIGHLVLPAEDGRRRRPPAGPALKW